VGHVPNDSVRGSKYGATYTKAAPWKGNLPELREKIFFRCSHKQGKKRITTMVATQQASTYIVVGFQGNLQDQDRAISSWDTVRPYNGRWCFVDGANNKSFYGRSNVGSPTYGNCPYCYNSGPVGLACNYDRCDEPARVDVPRIHMVILMRGYEDRLKIIDADYLASCAGKRTGKFEEHLAKANRRCWELPDVSSLEVDPREVGEAMEKLADWPGRDDARRHISLHWTMKWIRDMLNEPDEFK
jgi:hypothetical protein